MIYVDSLAKKVHIYIFHLQEITTMPFNTNFCLVLDGFICSVYESLTLRANTKVYINVAWFFEFLLHDDLYTLLLTMSYIFICLCYFSKNEKYVLLINCLSI